VTVHMQVCFHNVTAIEPNAEGMFLDFTQYRMQGFDAVTPGQHAILDTPRGSASLAPAVAANPKMAIEVASEV